MSAFGDWTEIEGLPAFACASELTDIADDVDQPRRFAVGNRRIQLVVDDRGTAGLWDTYDGLRWVTSVEPNGTGLSRVVEDDDTVWSTVRGESGAATVEPPIFGPTWFDVSAKGPTGLGIERRTLCLEGETPWVLTRVRLSAGSQARKFRLIEEWAVRPRPVVLGYSESARARIAEEAIEYQVAVEEFRTAVLAIERRRTTEIPEPDARMLPLDLDRIRPLFGDPHRVLLELVAPRVTLAAAAHDNSPHPTLTIALDVVLDADETRDIWFRFGLDDSLGVGDPSAAVETSMGVLRRRLPTGDHCRYQDAVREVPWHAALLTGGACVDGVLGGHTLDQGSAYAFSMGFNGAARDPLQHALPLVYFEPDLALSVLRNTLSWSNPLGELPYALDSAKQPWTAAFQPSDQPLWALWLAAEYAAATGDLASFAGELGFHPMHNAEPVSLSEHLRRQFRFLVDEIGFGEHGHLHMCNADWNDMALWESGVDPATMKADGESVLNSAMAAWVLPVWAGLCERLGDHEVASEARAVADRLRDAVRESWNGRWYKRAFGPNGAVVGDDDLWLENQPWAILCGAAEPDQAKQVLGEIDSLARSGSPLGACVRWRQGDPSASSEGLLFPWGEGTNGGVWFSINMTLIWAAAQSDIDLAWNEWYRMSLTNHARTYPDIWEGTLSGPDAYNSPSSPRPGHTWGRPTFGMQAFPVHNLHSHAQPLLSYLRLLGVVPADDGALMVRGGDGSFASQTFAVNNDGSGRLTAKGDVVVRHPGGETTGKAGELQWARPTRSTQPIRRVRRGSER